MANAKVKTKLKKAAKSSTKIEKKAPGGSRTLHHRVTAGRTHIGQAFPGMHLRTKMTHAGATAHFDVSYLTSLGKKGAALAGAILQDCERDFATLQQGVEPANFVSSSVWLSLNPRPNFVDQTDPSDTSYPSIGCSVLFLNWLTKSSRLGGSTTLLPTTPSRCKQRVSATFVKLLFASPQRKLARPSLASQSIPRQLK